MINDVVLPGMIGDVIEEIKAAKSRKELYAALDAHVENGELKCVDSTVFICEGYKFQVTLSIYVEHLDVKAVLRDSPHIEWVERLEINDGGASGCCVVLTIFRNNN